VKALLTRLLYPSVNESYGRGQYFRDGLVLMLLKYTVDAAVIVAAAGVPWTPLDYVASTIALHGSKAAQFPVALNLWLLAWTLIFVCIGVVLSVRRAKDAGVPPWLVVAFFLPILNYALMLLLVLLPTAREVTPATVVEQQRAGPHSSRAVLLGVVSGLLAGVALVALGTLLIQSYGWTLFLATPFVIGAASAFVARRVDPAGPDATGVVVLATLASVAGGVVFFAIEGLVCLAMAVPLVVPLAMIGGIIGRDLARAAPPQASGLMLMLLLVPTGHVADWVVQYAPQREVMSAVEIDAPPEKVWGHVVSFSDISTPPAWYFRLGLAHPLRAHIDGTGVGAIRWCEFTTGAFREPITAWEQPTRLAFDVTEQPPPLQEWSPWRNIYAPHLDGFFRSTKGEFRLVRLPGNRTRLEGRTWYSLRMQPQLYWTALADAIVHRIHERVLDHIRIEAQGS
jgi:hypothetical protein